MIILDINSVFIDVNKSNYHMSRIFDYQYEWLSTLCWCNCFHVPNDNVHFSQEYLKVFLLYTHLLIDSLSNFLFSGFFTLKRISFLEILTNVNALEDRHSNLN